MKYKVFRIWEIEANDICDAIEKTKNWQNYKIHVEEIPPKVI